MSRSPGKILDSFIGLPSDDVLIASISFGICLFQENDPQFFVSLAASAEDRGISIGLDRDVPIDFDDFPDAIDAEPDKEIPMF